MRLAVAILAVILAVPALASAQDPALGSDLTGYRRFVVYPHLQKGWESTQRGEREQALTELERAHSLAPDSTTVTLHLAAAYRRFGELNRAEALLQQHLTRTPDDARVRGALNELRAMRQSATTRAIASPCADPASAACGKTAMPASTPERVERTTTAAARTAEAAAAIEPKVNAAAGGSAAVSPIPPTLPVRAREKAKPPVVEPDPASQLRAGFALALQARRFDDALQQADALVVTDRGARLLDELSYKLVDAGAPDHAMHMLLRAYPFKTATAAERDTLLQRLTLLIAQQHATITDADLSAVREPLDSPALRSRQAMLWADLNDCDAVRRMLEDMSADYGYDDFMRLGDCSGGAPAVAGQAYARAHALQPGSRGSRALGYQAYAAGDYRTALDAWRSVGPDRLGEDALSAVTTALAAGEKRLAMEWLQSYREQKHALDRRYWSLLGQSHEGTDTPGAIAALERAVGLEPDVDDYFRLARLERKADRQVHWLERAADLDRTNGRVQLQLAYAYSRAGREAPALNALERAAALDPDNMSVQIELGYAHWRAGHAALAKRALERALSADPSNAVLTKQLVYVTQRLSQNDAARKYAEQVLDIPSAFDDTETAANREAASDRRFAMQRLHEDLGRRVTINLDGFSGTHVGTATSSPLAGNRHSSYSQLEADVRLGSPAIRDGSTVSAYARVFGDGGELRKPVPSENAMLGVGLRWKPWRRQVIYVAAENLIGLEDRSRRDVLLRASASFLNGGRLGDDWHASPSGWVSTNLYLDAAHYVKADYTAFTADYRTSYHRKLAGTQTLEPYGHVQFNSGWDTRIHRDVRAGLGVRWNLWHGGSTYDADPHKLSLGLEFQQAFETYLPDRNGVFVTLGIRW